MAEANQQQQPQQVPKPPAEAKKGKKVRQTSPKDIQLLNESDQESLIQLQNALSSTGSRNLRGKQLKTFNDMIKIIQKFCIRGDAYDWRRCYVCGICWLSNGIAINNRRFGCMLGKCKSSINGSFQQLGYVTAPSRSESYDAIAEAIPALKNDMSSLREWTVRVLNPGPQVPPNVGDENAVQNPEAQQVQQQVDVVQQQQQQLQLQQAPVQLEEHPVPPALQGQIIDQQLPASIDVSESAQQQQLEQQQLEQQQLEQQQQQDAIVEAQESEQTPAQITQEVEKQQQAEQATLIQPIEVAPLQNIPPQVQEQATNETANQSTEA